MKKYWKKGLALLLAAAMSLSCMTAAFAVTGEESISTTPPTIIAVDVPSDYQEETGVQPRSVYYYQNASLYNGGHHTALDYYLQSADGYAKIWVKNTSSEAVRVLTKYNGSYIGSGFTIAAGYQQVIYISANGNYGSYTTTVETVNGATLYGLVSVKVGTQAEAGYPN